MPKKVSAKRPRAKAPAKRAPAAATARPKSKAAASSPRAAAAKSTGTAKSNAKPAVKKAGKATKTSATTERAVAKAASKGAGRAKAKRPTKAPASAASGVEAFGGSDRSAAVAPGAKAPDFRLQDQDGKWLTSRELRGTPYVLYFYPKDDTPGCTQEACDFRDAFGAFKRAGARVLGVSPDSVATHAKFVGKHRLPITLLSDSSREVCAAYGVWVKKRLYGREYMGVERSTFVVGPNGVVRRVWRGVKVPGHAAAVLAAVRERG